MMVKLKNTLFITTLFILLLSNCGKYDEGPDFSLRTKKSRIVGEWKIEISYTDGVENTLGVHQKNQYYIFNADGTGFNANDEYTVYFEDVPFVFEASKDKIQWEFDDKKENYRIRSYSDSSNSWDNWSVWFKIIRLTNKEFWVTYIEFDGEINIENEIHYISK